MANWNGGVIGAANIPTTTVASGMWPLAEVNQYISSGDWPPLETSDPYFQNNVILLHGDGTNGAQNNTFLDSSTNNFTITRSGNTTQGTFSPFSKPDGGWGNYFDGTGDYLSVADNAALRMDSGDFTIEFWINFNSIASYQTAFSKGYISTGDLLFQTGNGNGRFIIYASGSAVITETGTAATSEWIHYALVRNSTTLTLYRNGVSSGSATNSTNLNSTVQLVLGAANAGGTGGLGQYPINGYMSNIRVVKGTAVYTSAFTPPTAPLTAVSGTSLLTCQSNRFKDNSTNNFTITRNGDVKVTSFSPFPLTVPYSPSVNGGSGYFDGAGDYIRTTSTIGVANTDFAIGLWFYPLSSSVIGLFDSGPNLANCFRNYLGNIIQDQNTTPTVSFAGAYQVSAWNWMCITKSGTSFTVYINGTSVGTGTCSNPMAEANFTVGAINSGGDGSYNGYISDFMFVNNSATELSVPTAPLAPISGTSFLVNFTNSGILDNTGFNNLETVGNAQIDTAVKKYGTGSMEFDGTGDFLQNSNVIDFQFGTGDFTVECWVNCPSFSSNQIFIDARGTSNAATPWQLYINTSSKVVFNYGSNLTGATSVSTNTWTHIAVARSGSSLRLFVNGTQDATATTSASISGAGGPFYIGRTWDTSGTVFLNGYIDDLRITKGIARYTSNFTPPDAAFPNIGE